MAFALANYLDRGMYHDASPYLWTRGWVHRSFNFFRPKAMMAHGSYTQMSARDPMPIMKANRNLIKGEAELIALALFGRPISSHTPNGDRTLC
jgi:hypothetical protein